MGSPHTYLVVNVSDASGKLERWAIEGDPTAALVKVGWKLRPGGTLKE